MVSKFLFLFLITGAILTSCTGNFRSWHKNEQIAFDLDSIRSRGRLTAVTDFNSVNYFIYKGEPMGFTYDLLKSFTDHLGIVLDIVTETHLQDAVKLLNNGQVDLIASGLTQDPGKGEQLQLTGPVNETRQVLVQRKPKNWRKMKNSLVEQSMIRNKTDLASRVVYVEEGASISDSVRTEIEKTGKKVTIVEVPYDSEVLVELVESGEIEFAVCDENIARANSAYYPDLDIATPVSGLRPHSWAVRKDHSAMLVQELNQWLASFRRTTAYAMMYNKYFGNEKSAEIVKSNYSSLNSGRVSQWDDIIKLYSESIRWDWRLLASLICQESRFIPDVISRKGAFGLMQLMPETGRHFGIDITSSPRNNIKAGTEYIKWLHTIFDPKIPDENERTNFILAAYNAGPGHVLDAMKLAEKNGYDPTKWENNVEIWLQKKSEPRYYNDSVVKNGYFRGKESIAFVNEVLGRYRHYKNIIP